MDGKTVLVVEDDHETLNVLSRTLAGGGFDVLWARNAEHAVELLQWHGSVDLLLTDVVLPGLSGPALVEQVTATHPKIRAVFVSAYDVETVRSHGVDPESAPFLAKPYEPAELLRMVRAALETAAGDDDA